MQGLDAWHIISPIISPMANKAMDNKEFGEAYIRAYIALKETDKVEHLRKWIKSEYSLVRYIMNNESTLAIKGYTFDTYEDMIKAAKMRKELLETIAKIMDVDL